MFSIKELYAFFLIVTYREIGSINLDFFLTIKFQNMYIYIDKLSYAFRSPLQTRCHF